MPLSNFIFSTYTAPTDIYTLSLHDALPISPLELGEHGAPGGLHCPLKMHGLNTHQRQSAAPREQPRCARTCRQVDVFFQSAPQPAFFVGVNFDEGHEIAVKHILGFGAQYVRESAGHAGAKIQAEWPEDDGDAAGHVFAAVLSDAFDDGKRAAVPDSKAFPGAAG